MDPTPLEASGRLTRTFVAVDIPDAARSALEGYLDHCRTLAPAFRWAPAANLHLTLRFCGGLDAGTLDALRRALRTLSGESFELRLGEVGAFGGGRPRVIWIGVAAGREALGALADSIEERCRQAGLEPEERPFRGHLTLARAAGRDRTASPLLPDLPHLPPWQVDRFVLYESRLGRGPAVYSKIEEFPLSPSR